MIKQLSIVAGAAAALALTAAGAALAAGVVNVEQKGIAFSAPSLTVAKGSIVNFMNNDATSHNITITGAGVNLNSGLQQPGVAFKAPMVKPGTYQVTCGIHPKMKMSLVVQ